jgi:hypothetical protein
MNAPKCRTSPIHALALALGMAATLVWLAPAAQAAPEKDLTALLPEKTALIVRVTNLEAALRGWGESPMFKKIEEAPIPGITRGLAKMRQDLQNVRLEHGVDLVDMFHAMLGKEFIIGVQPDGSALFAARGRNAEDLRAAVDIVIAGENDDGKVKEDNSEIYKTYEIRGMLVSDNPQAGAPFKLRYHVLTGDILLVSRSREAIKQAIDLMRGEKEAGPNLYAKHSEALKQAMPDALATVYVNTAGLAKSEAVEKMAAVHLRNPMFKLWYGRVKRHMAMTRHMMISFKQTDEAWDVKSTFLFDKSKLPAAYQTLIPAKGAALNILRVAPENSVFTVAHQVNKSALWRAMLDALKEANPQIALRAQTWTQMVANMAGVQSFEDDILDTLGDQTLLYGMPGPDKTPPALAFALEVKEASPLPQVLQSLIGTGVTIHAMEARNNERQPDVTLKRSVHWGVPIMTVVIHKGEVAGIMTPTLFKIGNYLVITTTIEAAKASINAHEARPDFKGPLADGKAFSLHGTVHVKGLATLLKKHEAWLVRKAMENDGKDEQTARRDLRNIRFILSLFKDITFTTSHTPGRIDREGRIELAE